MSLISWARIFAEICPVARRQIREAGGVGFKSV